MMLDMKTLLSEFSTHVASMSDDDVRASIQKAENLTAGCANEVGDIGEFDISDCYETKSKSIPICHRAHRTYSYSSPCSVASYSIVATNGWTGVAAA